MSETTVISTLGEILTELREQRKSTDIQLAKIHDLVNSQLSDAVDRFSKSLETIKRLEAGLSQKGAIPLTSGDVERGQADTAALATMEAKQGLAQLPAPPPAPTPDPVPEPEVPDMDELRAKCDALIANAKAMAAKEIEQAEIMGALIMQRAAQEINERRGGRLMVTQKPPVEPAR